MNPAREGGAPSGPRVRGRAGSRPVLCRTDELDDRPRAAAGALLGDAFGPDMTEQDWEHCLGGVHAVLREDGELVGHGAVVRRQLRLAGRAVRTGYVEGVAVRADRRGRGHGAALMEALEGVIRGGFELGALSATDQAAGFYVARGWSRWRGPSSAFTPRGIEPTPGDDGSLHVLPVTVVPDVHAALTCEWRDGDLW